MQRVEAQKVRLFECGRVRLSLNIFLSTHTHTHTHTHSRHFYTTRRTAQASLRDKVVAYDADLEREQEDRHDVMRCGGGFDFPTLV